MAPEQREENKMLDQLVESKSSSRENTRRSGFLLSVCVVMILALVSGWTYSLFGKEYGVSDDLELSQLVAPVPIAEEEPPKPEPEDKPEKQEVKQTTQQEVTVRKDLIARIDQSPTEPPKVSTDKFTGKSIPKFGPVVRGNQDVDATVQSTGRTTTGDSGGSFSEVKPSTEVVKTTEPTKPPPPPPPAPPKPSKPISKGVINGSATSLPKPPYPAAAKAVRAAGAVNVQVLIDENGNVVSANAVSGHPLLRQAAEQAARGAKFKPTLLSGQAVKVNGVIVYNFVP